MQTDDSTDLDSISVQMKQVRALAFSLLDRAESGSSLTDLAAAVEKAGGVLKLAAEIEKNRREVDKVTIEISKLRHEQDTAVTRERYERRRGMLQSVAPVTLITLAATISMQAWIFWRSEQNQNEAAMEARWQDAVKTISATGALSPGVIALQPFLRSTEYRVRATELAINLLTNSSDFVFFRSLFPIALAPEVPANFDRLIRLDQALVARGDPVWNKSWDREKQKVVRTGLSKDENATLDYMDKVLPDITSAVGSILKTARPAHIDFSATLFNSGNWQGLNFGATNLSNARLHWMNLQ